MKRFNRISRAFVFVLVAVMLGGATTAFATTEIQDAVNDMVERGIYQGDENGNLNLDKSLTRAELAVILTRLAFSYNPGGIAELEKFGVVRLSDPENIYNKFTDIPAWALPYVEYCYEASLINGVTPTLFDPQGIVNPKMVCTVVLRWLKIAETDWDYNTSLKKAQEIGLTNGANVSGATIARGDMALVIRRGMDQKAKSTTTYTPTPTPTPTPVPTTTPGAGTTMTIEEMKAEVLRLVNIERVNAGVPELEVSDALMTSAQLKADDMRINNYYGHNSPTYGTPSAMIKKYAGVGGAENYAYGQTTASWAVKWWMNSSLHKAAMLNTKYTHIGIGIVEDPISGYVWVQHFATIK